MPLIAASNELFDSRNSNMAWSCSSRIMCDSRARSNGVMKFAPSYIVTQAQRMPSRKYLVARRHGRRGAQFLRSCPLRSIATCTIETMSTKRFAGVFTPIATPFASDDTVDERGLASNVKRWMTTPLTGLVVLGSNGEAPQLDDDEADRVVEIVRAGVPKDRPLIVGTGRESTKATIAATGRAAERGADAAL